MRALVWRYVSAMHRKCDENTVTEDDISELKSEISSFRFELLDILNKNGMDTPGFEKKDKTILGRKMKIWERRLMKDFKVAPIISDSDSIIYEPPPENETSLARFKRIAKLAALNSNLNKWKQVVTGACLASQIGYCNTSDSIKKKENLQKAMEEAKKMINSNPAPWWKISPIKLPDTTGKKIFEVLKDEENSITSEDISKLTRSLTPKVIIRHQQDATETKERLQNNNKERSKSDYKCKTESENVVLDINALHHLKRNLKDSKLNDLNIPTIQEEFSENISTNMFNETSQNEQIEKEVNSVTQPTCNFKDLFEEATLVTIANDNFENRKTGFQSKINIFAPSKIIENKNETVEAIEMNEIPEIQILKSTSTSTEEDESKKSYFNKYGWL